MLKSLNRRDAEDAEKTNQEFKVFLKLRKTALEVELSVFDRFSPRPLRLCGKSVWFLY